MGRRDLTNAFREHARAADPHNIFAPIRRKSPHLLAAVKLMSEVSHVERLVGSIHKVKSRGDWGLKVIKALNGLSENLGVFKKDLESSFYENEETKMHRMEIQAYLQKRFNHACSLFRKIHQESSIQDLLLEKYSKKTSPPKLKITINPVELDSVSPVAFSSEERQHLEEETKFFDAMETTYLTSNQETQNIERQLRELFDLHERMVEQISEQANSIENIHVMAAESRSDVKEGNEELAEATQSTWSQKTLQTCLILVLSAFLLVFHWLAV